MVFLEVVEYVIGFRNQDVVGFCYFLVVYLEVLYIVEKIREVSYREGFYLFELEFSKER